MISRVAESCFWLHRYMERADNTARMAEVNLSFVLDAELDPDEAWRPALVVTGEEPRFVEMHGSSSVEDGESVLNHLVWDERNPVSILSSVRWARENARTIRETISREMWESINELWLWLSSSKARRSYERERSDFFEGVKRAAMNFRGVTSDSMLLEEPVEFMRLGVFLERAGMTSRILDVRHHALARRDRVARGLALWGAVLRSCGAVEGFSQRGRAFTGPEVAEFLLRESAHPRSVRHCLDRASAALGRIREPIPNRPDTTTGILETVGARVSSHDPRELSSTEIHEHLTDVIDTLARVCEAIHVDFFDARLESEAVVSQRQS